MRIYFTYKQYTRFHDWVIRHQHECKEKTGSNIAQYFGYLTKDGSRNLGPLLYAHLEAPWYVLYWLKRNCPYPFVKDKIGEPTILERVRYFILTTWKKIVAPGKTKKP